MRDISGGHTPGGRLMKKVNIAADCLFGRQPCSKLLVMIHDAQKSIELFGRNQMYYPLVISRYYWPLGDNIALTDTLQSGYPDLGVLDKKYRDARPKRRIRWIPSLSSVDMDLTIGHLNYNLNSVPYYAYLAMQRLADRGAVVSDMNENDKEGLIFWAERGFVRHENNRFTLKGPSGLKTVDIAAVKSLLFSPRDGSTTIATAPKSQPPIPPHIGPMVSAMLTNLGPMPPARIHAMLMTMSGLKEPLESLTIWLHDRPDIQFDPTTGAFCRKVR
jgi:hypothetical protein